MPYIEQWRRDELDQRLLPEPTTQGELNYCITQLCRAYHARAGGDYAAINDVVGVLGCVQHEFYRRIVVPYEHMKIADNGDVY